MRYSLRKGTFIVYYSFINFSYSSELFCKKLEVEYKNEDNKFIIHIDLTANFNKKQNDNPQNNNLDAEDLERNINKLMFIELREALIIEKFKIHFNKYASSGSEFEAHVMLTTMHIFEIGFKFDGKESLKIIMK